METLHFPSRAEFSGARSRVLQDFLVAGRPSALPNWPPALVKQRVEIVGGVQDVRIAMTVSNGHVGSFVHVLTLEMPLDDAILERMERDGSAKSARPQHGVGHLESVVQFVKFVVDEYPQRLEGLRGNVRMAVEGITRDV
jgi:hypothetical protein